MQIVMAVKKNELSTFQLQDGLSLLCVGVYTSEAHKGNTCVLHATVLNRFFLSPHKESCLPGGSAKQGCLNAGPLPGALMLIFARHNAVDPIGQNVQLISTIV